MHAYLKLDHIDKSYTRGNATTEVLKEINLTIDKGEYLSIIGHSGCGKWTDAQHRRRPHPHHQWLRAAGKPRSQLAEGPDRAVVFQNHSLLPVADGL